MSDSGERYSRQFSEEENEDSFDDRRTMTNLLFDVVGDFSDSSTDDKDDNTDDSEDDSNSNMWCDEKGRRISRKEFKKMHEVNHEYRRGEFAILEDGLSLSTIESCSVVTDSDIDTVSLYSRGDDLDECSILISLLDGDTADVDLVFEKTPREQSSPVRTEVAKPQSSPLPVAAPLLSPAATKSETTSCCCLPCGGLWSTFLRALGLRRKS